MPPAPGPTPTSTWPPPTGRRPWPRTTWTGATYINFQTADEDEDRVRAAYGANCHRLVELKRRYDPGNLFRANRDIRP